MRINHFILFILFWILILILTHGDFFGINQPLTNLSHPVLITGTELLAEKIITISSESHNLTSLRVKVDISNPSTAIKRVITGEADIGLLSRPLSWEESSQNPMLNQTRIGYDAFAIVVSPSNRILGLTEEEVRGIFTGKIRDFKEAGGISGDPIQVLGRKPGDPSRNFFRKIALKTDMYSETMNVFYSDDEIILAMEGLGNETMISQLPLSKVPETLRILSIRPTGHDNYIRPTFETVTQEEYPYTWPLYIVTRRDSMKDVQDFVAFLFSPYGKELLVKEGIIPIKG